DCQPRLFAAEARGECGRLRVRRAEAPSSCSALADAFILRGHRKPTCSSRLSDGRAAASASVGKDQMSLCRGVVRRRARPMNGPPHLQIVPDNRTVSIDLTVQQQLDQLDVPYEIFPCDPALADTANFCAAYGFRPEDSANTILVIGKSDPPVYAACVVLATTRLDVNKMVRQRLGARKASFAPAEETRAIRGMEIGGVTVFGLPPTMPIWIDARVVARERIVLGGGSRSSKVIAAPAILLRLPNAEVVDGLATIS